MKSAWIVAVLIFFACNRDAVESSIQPAPSAPTASTQTTATSPPPVSGPKLLPVDEAKSDPSLAAYREALLAAVRRRDVEAVVEASDPNIRTSFGDGGGAADLRKLLQQPAMWAELEEILTHGGTFLEGSERLAFWAPYVYSAWPESHDAFTSLAVIAENAPLATAPNGPPIAMLSYDIVERAGDPQNGWQEVRIADGRTGVVETKFLRSPVDYRAGFNKEGERWRMTGLVAGD